MGDNLVSPDQMMSVAKDMMLDGREPQSLEDHYLILNFVAANLDTPIAESATLLMVMLYDIPVTTEEAKEIVKFQLNSRQARLN
jgi:hypothetical protein